MGDNFFTPWIDGTTKFTAALMNAPLVEFDKAVTYIRNIMIHCDGAIAYNSGTGGLSWSDTLRIHFNRSDGDAVQNVVAVGSITLADNEFAYVTLSETNDATITVSKASITTGSASNFLVSERLVLGYRNTASNQYFPVYLFPSTYGNAISDIVQDTTPQLGGVLDLNQKSLDISTALSTDHTAVGLIDNATVDTNATGFGAALCLSSDGNYDESDASAAATMPVTALAITTGTGAGKTILLQGYIRDNTWNWTVGGLIYASETTGGLTQTVPTTSGTQVQVVGWAKSADVMYFNPSLVLVEI